MHKFVFHNDRILPLSEVRLSPGQAGLLSGWGLFTTLHIYGAKPFAFEKHWNRLSTDARRISLPFEFREDIVRGHLQELLAANGLQDGCARVYFIYNKFGVWCSDESFPTTDLLMYTTDLVVREGLVKLGVMPYGRFAANQLVGTKITSWLPNVWSLEQAHRRGLDEVILLNERGEVTECTAANVFLVRGDSVETPPLSSGCLAGVTREILLEIGRDLGVPIVQRPVSLQDLHRAEEVFITSTTRNLQAVSHIEDHEVPRAPGPITARLSQMFSDYVWQYFGSQAK